MKRNVFFGLLVATFLLLGAAFAVLLLRSRILSFNDLDNLAAAAGLPRLASQAELAFAASVKTSDPGSAARNDSFPVTYFRTTDFDVRVVEAFEEIYTATSNYPVEYDADMIYKNNFIELPLFPEDYYYRKYENGLAGINGINKVPVLRAGDRIALIRQMYINVKSWNGYVQPPGYYFGSGLCWSTSTLGYLMDDANNNFRAKYGVPLFTFQGGDRAPHPHNYKTYGKSNRGWGYTVLQISAGNPLQDYRFTVNPAIKNIPELADMKLKIVMIGTTTHPSASHGQSLGGYIVSNKQF